MRFSTFVAALLPASAAMAAEWVITVGSNNTLTFNPSNITAAPGDTVVFQFVSKNHSATQSSFPTPCTKLNDTAFDTGFQNVGTSDNFLNSTVLTVNDTNPLWFYCAQTMPADHCEMGMVFAINANDNKTFAQFQNNAKATNASTNGTSTNGTTSSGSSSGAAPTQTQPSGALRVGTTAGMLLSGVALAAGLIL